MKITTVIFDLDGTITRPFFDFDAIREEIGLGRDAGPILELMPKMSPEQRERTKRIIAEHEKAAVEQSTLNYKAAETLDALRQKNIHIGILTRNTRQNALAIARKHSLSFDAIVDRTDGPVKPDAFGVLSLCETFATRPDQALVVGDFLYDLLSATAAGAIPVLLNNTEKAREYAKFADFTITSLDHILPIIENTG